MACRQREARRIIAQLWETPNAGKVRHHRDDGDDPRELDEIARRSETPQLHLLATNTVLPKITRFRISGFDVQQEASASRRRSAIT